MPQQWLVDGGYPAHEQIEAVADQTEVYAPVPEPRAKKDAQGNQIEQPARDKHQPKLDDSAAVASWRTRMGQPEAQAIYRDRAATAECVNAQARNRGLTRMAGARVAQGTLRRAALRAGPQPDAHRRAGPRTARPWPRCIRNSGSNWMNSEKTGASPRNDLVASLMGSLSSPAVGTKRCDASCRARGHRASVLPRNKNVLRL